MKEQTENYADQMTRAQLVALITRFIASRPGFDSRNYGSMSGLRADMRTAQAHLQDARAMLATLAAHDDITADAIRGALRSGGRLELQDNGTLYYCAGQYYPTEYRAGACRVLSQLLWDSWRAELMQDRAGDYHGVGDAIRKRARLELGRGTASRWFR